MYAEWSRCKSIHSPSDLYTRFYGFSQGVPSIGKVRPRKSNELGKWISSTCFKEEKFFNDIRYAKILLIEQMCLYVLHYTYRLHSKEISNIIVYLISRCSLFICVVSVTHISFPLSMFMLGSMVSLQMFFK